MKNKKQKLWKKYVASKSTEDREKFVRCKNYLRSLTRTRRKDFEKALTNIIKNSPKPFLSYVQSKLKTKVKIPTLTKLEVFIKMNLTIYLPLLDSSLVYHFYLSK